MKLPKELISKLGDLNLPQTPLTIMVTVSDQSLTLFEGEDSILTYKVSTAKQGTGQLQDSQRTPLGLHRIAKKIGKSSHPHTIFRSRDDTGVIWKPGTKPVESEDLILTHILWLEGLEEGFNRGIDSQGRLVDSFNRYIYIHGTNHEDQLGKPASHGCIRMSTPDVMELFKKVPEETLVWIRE